MPSSFENHYFSCVRFLKAISAQVGTSLGNAQPFLVVNLDAHSDLDNLPQQDVLGIEGFLYGDLGKFKHVLVNFHVLTYNDTELYRHIKMLGVLTTACAIEQKLPLFRFNDATQAVEEYSWMISNTAMRVQPMVASSNRTSQPVEVHFLSGDPS